MWVSIFFQRIKPWLLLDYSPRTEKQPISVFSTFLDTNGGERNRLKDVLTILGDHFKSGDIAFWLIKVYSPIVRSLPQF